MKNMLFINIFSIHNKPNDKVPSKSGAGPAEDDQYSRPEAEGQGPPGRPWTLWCRVAWTNERTGRSHVTELESPKHQAALGLFDVEYDMDQWENRSQSRDWVRNLGATMYQAALGHFDVEYDIDQWQNRPQPRDWAGSKKHQATLGLFDVDYSTDQWENRSQPRDYRGKRDGSWTNSRLMKRTDQ